MPAFGLLGVKAYARARADLGLIGSTPKAVRDALVRLDVGRDDNGQFDADELHRKWQDDLVARARGRPGEGAGEPVGVAGRGRVPPDGDGEVDPSALPADWQSIKANDFAKYRAIKEWFLAGKHRLDYEERLGELVSLNFHFEKVQDLAYGIRQVLNQAPGRHAPQLAGVQQDFRAGLESLRAQLEEAGDKAGLAVLARVVALDSDATAAAQRVLNEAMDDVLFELTKLEAAPEADGDDAPERDTELAA